VTSFRSAILNCIAAQLASLTHPYPMTNQRKRGGAATKRMLVAAMLWLSAVGQTAGAGTTVEVIDTEPANRTVTLDAGQTFYMRIAYSTDTPVRIWARPYFEGREVNAGSNPSRVHEGEGETLGWFFFLGDPGQQVDEIRISAGDGSTTGTHELERLPVRITAGTATLPSRAEPAWLAQLKTEEQRLQRADYERRMSEPLGAGDQAVAAGFMLVVLAIGIGSLLLPLRAMRRWEGGWRVAAAVPLLWVGFVVLRIVVGTASDPTSHNLWPFEILYAGVVSLALIVTLTVVRRAISVRARRGT
jgi:hypothetical protein